MRSLICIAAVVLVSMLSIPTPVPAAPYWGPAEVDAWLARPGAPPAGSSFMAPRDGPRNSLSYADEYARIAAFLRTWQVSQVGADFGGIREGEQLQNIIQTDNTSESIWVWARYYELTGDNQYYQNILNAFTYSLNHPAYLEEGGALETTGYYRMYNCGWAVRAEQKFRDVYGDLTYKAYGDSCAGYLRYHTLRHFNNSFYDNVNTHVLAWACGNLYLAGVHEGNQAWKDRAVSEMQTKVKVWVEADPTQLANETWAMSGGATMWGLLNSYFLANPGEAPAWLAAYKGSMDTYSSPGDFTNAWNGWYAYGHRAVGLTLHDSAHLALHIALTDTLKAEDGDEDGGVPAKPADDDTMDQTWVSNYLAVFGLSDALGPTSAVDAAIPGTPLPILDAAPNPFTRGTLLTWNPGGQGIALVSIYDMSGRRVVDLPTAPSGPGALQWRPEGLPSGTYVAVVRSPEGTASRRLTFVR
jgi:hypothetical protein